MSERLQLESDSLLSVYLQQLKRGSKLNCATPDGLQFQIQSKVAHGLTWYRAYPARSGCLNRYSLLSDAQLADWLSHVQIVDNSEVTV